MTASTKRQLRRLAGEFFREAAVLILVLSPLESLVSTGRLTVVGGVATLVIGAGSAGVGFWLGLEED